MSELVRGGRWHTAGAFELLVEEAPHVGAPLREGHDFVSQRELGEARATCGRILLPPLAARLTVLARADFELWAACGGSPGVETAATYPAWRVDLWRWV